MKRWFVLLSPTGVLFALGCGDQASTPELAQVVRLSDGIIASVGSEAITSSFVERAVREQRRPAAEVLDGVIFDTLLAAEAHQRFRGRRLLATIERGVLGRGLLEAQLERARAEGPIRPDELASLRHERWMDVDRPGAALTVHAVVLVKSPGQEEGAARFAERIRKAVMGVNSSEAFVKAAKKVRQKGLKRRVEHLPYITEDARAVYPHPDDARRNGPQVTFDPTFASAANRIPEVGGVSEVVKSSHGFHVIFLAERLDPVHLNDAQLIAEFGEEIFSARARKTLTETTERLRSVATLEYSNNIDELTALTQTHP